MPYARLVEALFGELERTRSSSKTDADSVLLKLHHVFGTMLVAALQLLDKGSVAQIELPGGRFIYQVSSTSGTPYTVYPAALSIASPYCPCMAFTTSVLLAAEQLMCKHLLATRLAMALGKCRETRVRGEAVALLMR
ncbi:Zinc finger SWIM domain-containing protein 7 [Naganishia albida]|nr:Zinc finger SWIM domain-containing protein 7 [Naganishia albida]